MARTTAGSTAGSGAASCVVDVRSTRHAVALTMPAGVAPSRAVTTRLDADSLGSLRPYRAARNDMALKARIEIETGGRTFASGLLLDIVAALRETARGDLLAIASDDPAVGRDLETWSRLTRNPIVAVTSENGRIRSEEHTSELQS